MSIAESKSPAEKDMSLRKADAQSTETRVDLAPRFIIIGFCIAALLIFCWSIIW